MTRELAGGSFTPEPKVSKGTASHAKGGDVGQSFAKLRIALTINFLP